MASTLSSLLKNFQTRIQLLALAGVLGPMHLKLQNTEPPQSFLPVCQVNTGSHALKATTNRTYAKKNCQSVQNPVEKEKKEKKSNCKA